MEGRPEVFAQEEVTTAAGKGFRMRAGLEGVGPLISSGRYLRGHDGENGKRGVV